MHFVVHWEYQGAPPSNIAQINAEFQELLKPYSWIRPVTNFYIVNVPSSDQYQAITNSYVATAKRWPSMYVVITPPMTGGRYAGQLPSGFWPDINSRST